MPAALHPTAAELKALALGQIDEASASSLVEHLTGCSDCQRRAAEVPGDTLVELLRAAQTSVVADAATPPAIAAAETIVKGLTAVSSAELPAALASHDRYRLIQPLGAGGMGTVWLAEHMVMNRQVALKIIHPEFLEKPGAIDRFRREVHAAARLHHPNIVTAHDAEQAGGVHFLVMEYVTGTDLQKMLEEHGPLPVAEACEYIRQAALGLQHAHEHGMVHRDIKPQNLMVSGGRQPPDLRVRSDALIHQGANAPRSPGVVKILDFGLASLTAEAVVPNGNAQPASTIANQRSSLTQAGSLMGTPDYMAPEQARDARTADIRSDIYSLGCTLYCLLTGKVPFPGGTAIDKVIAHAEHAPQAIGELRKDAPAALVKVLDRMMEKDPTERFQTPAEIAAALAPFTATALVKPRRRWRPLVAAAALAVTVLIAGAIIYVQTDVGEFEIKTDDEDIAVMVNRQGLKITDMRTGREYLLKVGKQEVRTGEYVVVPQLLTEDIEIEGSSGKTFTIKRGGRAVATAKLRAKGDQQLTGKTDEDRLQGVWVGVSGWNSGQQIPDNEIRQCRVHFTGERMEVEQPTRPRDGGIFHLRDANPKKIDIIGTDQKGRYGIYRFNGDELQLCMGEDNERPKEFKSDPKYPTRLFIVLRREGTNQEAKIEAATNAAGVWLNLVDEGKYAESWNTSSELSRRALGKKEYVEVYERLYKGHGRLTSRTYQKTEPPTKGPAGEYVVIRYGTSFENVKGTGERIYVMLDKDGRWRVAGYWRDMSAEAQKGQDPKIDAAVKIAEGWLKLIDEAKADQAWEQSASIGKKMVTQAAAVQGFEKVMKQVGKLKSRSLWRSQYVTSVPSLPPGEFVLLQYASKFEKLTDALEIVLIGRDTDGQWRPMSYSAVPRPPGSEEQPSAAPERRNPFGVPDVEDPDGGEAQTFAANSKLKGGADDPNAAQWVAQATGGDAGSLDGQWFGRWWNLPGEAWKYCKGTVRVKGTVRIKTVGERVYILCTDNTDTILMDLRRENGRLVGRYQGTTKRTHSGPIVFIIAGPDRLDGEFGAPGVRGRQDFRRKLEQTDQQKIQGTWKPAAVQVPGIGAIPEAMLKAIGPTITFTADKKVVWKANPSAELKDLFGKFGPEGVYDLDATKSPRTITLSVLGKDVKTPLGTPAPRAILGIYRFVDNDTLEICIAADPDRPEDRPTKFEAVPGKPFAVATLKRQGGTTNKHP